MPYYNIQQYALLQYSAICLITIFSNMPYYNIQKYDSVSGLEYNSQ